MRDWASTSGAPWTPGHTSHGGAHNDVENTLFVHARILGHIPAQASALPMHECFQVRTHEREQQSKPTPKPCNCHARGTEWRTIVSPKITMSAGPRRRMPAPPAPGEEGTIASCHAGQDSCIKPLRKHRFADIHASINRGLHDHTHAAQL